MTMIADFASDRSIKRGLQVILIGLLGFLVWAVSVEIDGAVIASGHVEYSLGRQVVQHPDGGVVSKIHVHDGSEVRAGDPIVTLDGIELIAQRNVIQAQLATLLAQEARLRAEAEGAVTVDFDGLPFDAEQDAIFAAGRATRAQARLQLAQKQAQANAIAAGRQRQLTAVRAQIALVQEELAAQAALLNVGLTQANRVSALQREEARLEAQMVEIDIAITEARGAADGYVSERLRLEVAARGAARTELATIMPRVSELQERLALIEALMDRLVVRAPIDGIVTALQIETIGGVIPSGADIASISPMGQPRIISVEVDPTQIDRVHSGQSVLVRFPTVDAVATPEISGIVRLVSPDTITNQTTGRVAYHLEVTIDDDLFPLPAGMPAQVFLSGGPRTLASYLVQPIADYWALAIRE